MQIDFFLVETFELDKIIFFKIIWINLKNKLRKIISNIEKLSLLSSIKHNVEKI